MMIEKVHGQRIKEKEKMEHNINDTDDIVAKMRLLVADGTIWLTQKEIAELFQTTKQSIGMHIRFILKHGELMKAWWSAIGWLTENRGRCKGNCRYERQPIITQTWYWRLRAVCAHQGEAVQEV